MHSYVFCATQESLNHLDESIKYGILIRAWHLYTSQKSLYGQYNILGYVVYA